MHTPRILLALLLALATRAEARIDYTLDGSDALRINQTRYSSETLRTLHKAAQRDTPGMTLADAARLLIDNHLIADIATRQVPAARLLDADDRVGFPATVALEDQYTATGAAVFHRELEASIARLPGKSLESAILERPSWSPARLRAALDLGPRQEFQLDEAGLATAKTMTVLRYRFPGGTEQTLSLADIYRRQNVQGRIALHGGDVAYLTAQARQRLGLLYVDDWLRRESGLSASTLTQIRQALRECALKDRYLAYLGLAADVHDDNDYLKTVAAGIGPAEIRAYYRKHREQFTRVAKARGHHITLGDQASADRVYAELQRGLGFTEAVRRYSIAEDKNASDPGALGWVDNVNNAPWRDTLLLVLPLNEISRPIKAPGTTPRWEIVKVDERREDYQDENSEGVRYQASRALAEARIARDFHTAKQDAFAHAEIALNRALIPRLPEGSD